MNLILTRSYWPTETIGRLKVGANELFTIEQPWLDSASGSVYASGRPYFSCIPEGVYKMIPFLRPNEERTWVLQNPDLGVYASKGDRFATWERFLCLFHRGNFVDDVQGCIAVGMSRAILANRRNGDRYEIAVSSSSDAMERLRAVLGELTEGHTLQIVQARGALFVDQPRRTQDELMEDLAPL